MTKEDKAANHKWYMREVWYPRNKTKHIAYQKEVKIKYRKWLDSLKDGKSCIKCGENHPATLDYHHRDKKTKKFSIATARRFYWNKEQVLSEIAKCDILCSNCHRKKHWNKSN